MPARFHSRAWVIWLISAGVLALTVRNPLYSLILLLVGWMMGAGAGWSFAPGRIGRVIIPVAAVFNALSVHMGQTVLWRFPAHWPWIGGPITLEAAVYGANNGLILLTLMVIFNAFNQLVQTGELVRFTPRALRDVGIVVLIAMTYVPEMIQQLRRIREAQAIRGHRLRRLRDWQPVVIPLLVGGLERALGLAEAMVARGYGQTAESPHAFAMQIELVGGLAATFGGWTLAFWWPWLGWLLMLVGVLLVAGLFWQLGKQAKYTRYRPRPWTNWDTLMAGTAVIPPLIAFLPLPFVNRATLVYSPYPTITLPEFDMVIGVALALLAFPAFINGTRINADTTDERG